MRITIVLVLLSASAAGPAFGQEWREARIVNISESTVKSESVEYSASPTAGTFPAVPTHIQENYRRLSTYTLSSENNVFVGRLRGKPIPGLKEGSVVRFFVRGHAIEIEAPGHKRRRLDLLNAK